MSHAKQASTRRSRAKSGGREAVILLYALLLAAMIASSSSALAQGGAVKGTFSTHRSVPAHPPQSGWQAHQPLIARQPAPDCELAGPEPDTVDADLWARLKLEYQRYCYKQAEILIHRRLQQLAAVEPLRTVDANNNRLRWNNLRGLKLLATTIDAAAVSNSVAAVVEDAGLPPSIVAPTVTDSGAETILFDKLASNPLKDAKFYFERGIASYRDGDLARALVDFDLAIEVDPNIRDAYIDQGITWYRMGNLNRALDVIAQAISARAIVRDASAFQDTPAAQNRPMVETPRGPPATSMASASDKPITQKKEERPSEVHTQQLIKHSQVVIQSREPHRRRQFTRTFSRYQRMSLW